jgi:hypothetical protein
VFVLRIVVRTVRGGTAIEMWLRAVETTLKFGGSLCGILSIAMTSLMWRKLVRDDMACYRPRES